MDLQIMRPYCDLNLEGFDVASFVFASNLLRDQSSKTPKTDIIKQICEIDHAH
jgi:hypothetical protein